METTMRSRDVYWLIAAIAVAAVAIALAVFIVILAPSDSNAAAASMPQVLNAELEAMAQSHSDRRAIPPISSEPTPSSKNVL